MSNKNNKKQWPTAVDLFCGCGAVSAGLRKRHFKVLAAVDNDPVACETYRLNHPRVKLYEDDITQLDPLKIKNEVVGRRDLALMVVCAPCQPFSSQNRSTGFDERVFLIFQAIRYASILKPKVIFFENVPGLTKPKYAKMVKSLQRGLKVIGYDMGEPEKIDVADYGVPQRRVRCIMVAKRGQLPALQSVLAPVGNKQTVRDAIADLPQLEAGEAFDGDRLHYARAHQPIALERLRHIPKDGGSRFSLPEHLVLECHRGKTGYPDVYGRMKWEDVAPTLTTGCTDVTRGRFAHPEDNRAITLREAARLQTFDDDYVFHGNSGKIARQIGNAVPVRFVESLIPYFRFLLKAS